MGVSFRTLAASGLLIAAAVGAFWACLTPYGVFLMGGNLDVGVNAYIDNGSARVFEDVAKNGLVRFDLIPPYTVESLDVTVFTENCSGVLQINATADGRLVGSFLVGLGDANTTSTASWGRFPPGNTKVDISVRAMNGPAHVDLYLLSFSYRILDYNVISWASVLVIAVGGSLWLTYLLRVRGNPPNEN